MKNLIILLAGILLASAGRAQTLPYDSSRKAVVYAAVVQTDSVKKDELFNRAMAWVAQNYKSANDVIQFKDKEAGKIIGKGMSDIVFDGSFSPIKGKVYYTFSLSFKDGKYRYEITNVVWQAYATKENPNPAEVRAEEQYEAQVQGKRGEKSRLRLFDATNKHFETWATTLKLEMVKTKADGSDW